MHNDILKALLGVAFVGAVGASMYDVAREDRLAAAEACIKAQRAYADKAAKGQTSAAIGFTADCPVPLAY